MRYSEILTETKAPIIPLSVRQHFLSDEYIDYVVENFKFVDHGEYIDHFLEDFDVDSDDKDAIRALLKKWLPKRLAYIERDLRTNAPSQIIRAIRVTPETFEAMDKAEHLKIGVFFGDGSFEPQNTNPIEIAFTVNNLRGVTIDWGATVASRIDYLYGDDEQEYQLVAGSSIPVAEIEAFDGKMERLDLSHWVTKTFSA